jgi:hypothetical protein
VFSKLFQENVPEGSKGDSLWEQCFEALSQIAQLYPVSKSLRVEEVDRLVVLVSKQIGGDFRLAIQEAVSDTVNGFVDDLPF